MKILYTIIILLLIQPPAFAAGKHALLIGIEDYTNSNIRSLNGSINDVFLMKNVLRERFGFKKDDFIVLLDEQATHTGIKNAFTKLINKIQYKDFVYIHFSGHGSQTFDLNGDQVRSGIDQTWVSYASRANNSKHIDNYDVLDDEINTWLAAIYAKTDHVIFVSDSCHSATVGRGEDSNSRSLKIDKRRHPLGKKPYTKIEKYYGIRIGSARDRESAIEAFQEDGQAYGKFTWHWARALQQAQADSTWNDVFKRAYMQVVTSRGRAQKPQMEGERSRQILGGNFIPLPPTITVSYANRRRVEIQAGHVAGVTVGSVYRLYKSKRRNVPRITITRVKAFKSYGKPTALFKRGDLVVEESHAYNFKPVKVYLSPQKQIIKSAFKKRRDGTLPLPGYTLTNNPAHADLRLHLKGSKLSILTSDQYLLDEELEISFRNPRRGIKLLQNNLNKLARVRELKTLRSSRRILPVTVEVFLLSPIRYCSATEDCIYLPNDLGLHRKTGPYSLHQLEKKTLNKGDILTFRLHNRSRRHYYCYLINISPNGVIEAIFPYPEEAMEYARIAAGETLDLIGETGLMAELVGEESIKIITSRHPFDVELLEQTAFEQRGGIEGSYNPLEQLLINAIHGQRGRISLRNDDWAAGLIEFMVK
jgi:hypothetical protein